MTPLERAAEVEAAAREMLRGGDHDGPCVNYEGAKGYVEFDSCSRHVAASDARHARLRAALNLEPD